MEKLLQTCTCTCLTSSPGLLFRQLGLNLLTWRTWIAHFTLRWWSWLVTFRNKRSFWGKHQIEVFHVFLICIYLFKLYLKRKTLETVRQKLVSLQWKPMNVLTTVKYWIILPSTLPSWNWPLYWGKPMSSSQPLRINNMTTNFAGLIIQNTAPSLLNVEWICWWPLLCPTYVWPRCGPVQRISLSVWCWTTSGPAAASFCAVDS